MDSGSVGMATSSPPSSSSSVLTSLPLSAEQAEQLGREAGLQYAALAEVPDTALAKVERTACRLPFWLTTSISQLRDCASTTESLLMRMDELQGVAMALGKDAARSRELDATLVTHLADLERVYDLIDKIGAHVNRVDVALTAMEGAVDESTRELNKQALRSTLGTVTRWFGGGAAAAEMPPFVRPPESFIDMDAAMATLRNRE